MTQYDTPEQPILLLGGGLAVDPSDGRICLTERTYDRLWAVLPVALLAQEAFILCSGGYSRMNDVEDVPETKKEGYQMADWLLFQGVPYQRIEVDATPESTIGNLVGAIRGGWLDPRDRRPPVVVTHTWHRPRVEVVGAELGFGSVNHIDAGIQGASPYEHISLEAHQVVLRGVGRNALLADPRSHEIAIGRYIEARRNDIVRTASARG